MQNRVYIIPNPEQRARIDASTSKHVAAFMGQEAYAEGQPTNHLEVAMFSLRDLFDTYGPAAVTSAFAQSGMKETVSAYLASGDDAKIRAARLVLDTANRVAPGFVPQFEAAPAPAQFPTGRPTAEGTARHARP